MSCPFKMIDAGFYDLDEECEGKKIPIHPDDDKETLLLTRYCSFLYMGKGKYRECVGEDKCPLINRK